jgi:hypothetical protein
LNPNSVFPELVFFDCHACHHPMSDLRWSARPSVGLGPGVIKFNDSNAIMLRLIAARVAPEAAKALGEKMRAMHFAVGESRDETRRLAGEIRVLERQLVEAFGRHEFVRADMQALLAGVIADGEAQEFIDFASAEQAPMAISSIVNAMKAAGHVSDDVFVAMNAALQKLNAAVEKIQATVAPLLTGCATAAPKSPIPVSLAKPGKRRIRKGIMWGTVGAPGSVMEKAKAVKELVLVVAM